jgi:hypothetical protein
MRTFTLVFAFVFSCAAGSAFAASCSADASQKNLAGAAKTSFMTKCESDAKAKCGKEAAAKKLSGAAETSFTAKCVKEAVGG